MQKIKIFISDHKFWSFVIILSIIILAYFIFFKKGANTEVRYVTETVVKGSVVSTVSGSGQIEATDTINLKTKTSGEINYVGVKSGELVKKGALIASVDSRDAKLALQNAQISLEKLTGNPDSLTLLQKQNSLEKIYSDTWNNMTSFTADMNDVIVGLEDLNNNYLGYKNKAVLSNSGKDKLNLSEDAYWNSKKSFDNTIKLYKSLSLSSSKEDIKNLSINALNTAKVFSNALKLSQASIDEVSNTLDDTNSTSFTASRKNIISWVSTVNGYVSNISSSVNNMEESGLSFENFIAGADELDIKSAKLNVDNKQAAYNDCYLYSPFDGVIATFTAKVGDSSSSTLGTLITEQKNARISLNEVDIAKIKLDQKVTLTFDAIDDLTITGRIAEIDSVGTVSQGVVSYNVAISLDVNDERVKPGMSISATIITNTAQDVIVVPNSAIKTKNGLIDVEVFESPLLVMRGTQGSTSDVLPKQIPVETGLVDDTYTEITLGLKEGDIIVTKTINGATSKSAGSTAPSILGAVGGSRTGGGANTFRAVRGN